MEVALCSKKRLDLPGVKSVSGEQAPYRNRMAAQGNVQFRLERALNEDIVPAWRIYKSKLQVRLIVLTL